MATPRSPDPQLDFARKVVQAAGAPLLLLDADLRVVAASRGYLRAFADGDAPEGRRLEEITGGAWAEARVHGLIEEVRRGAPEGRVDTLVAGPQGRRRVRVEARPTDPTRPPRSPLVLAIEDLTDWAAREAAREAERREAAALLREAQHRTANNLSMISAILAMKARGVASAEARAELEGARRRVLAMAAIERHLHVEDPGKATAIGPYLEVLCRRLAESLLGDGRQIEIAVRAEPGARPQRLAVILGLVVTELVINALKYAFPDGRRGRIVVDYWETARGWCAAVTDDGEGLPDRPGSPQGLGAGIVAALADQLGAEVRLTNSPHGLRVELCCEKAAD